MISYSAPARALMDGPAYNVWLQVLVQKPVTAETFNFFDYGVGDPRRIKRATLNASVDLATIEGTVTFQRGLGEESLSPYITSALVNDTVPLMWPGNLLTLYCAVTAPGVEPTGTDFKIILNGRIDHVNAAGPDEVVVRFRDVGAALLNKWIEAPKPYGGTPGGIAAETVIASILTDNGFAAGTVLNPGADSGFMIRQFMQERMPVLEALRRIALQIGWEMRHYPRFGPIVLFQDPDRAKASQATISPDIYRAVTKLEVGDDDVRNRWRIGYPAVEGDAPTLFVTVQNAASIAQYGPRFAEIVEDSSSNINTLGEATTFVNAALADTKDPLSDFAVEMLPWPAVELNDVYTFPANGVHLDASHVWAISGYQHNFSKGSGRTTLFTRGKPIAAYRDYRRGVRRTLHVSVNDAPTATYLDGVDYPEGTLWLKTPDLSFPTAP